jgi:hypothetical protein
MLKWVVGWKQESRLGGFFSIEKIEVDIDRVVGGREGMWSRRSAEGFERAARVRRREGRKIKRRRERNGARAGRPTIGGEAGTLRDPHPTI